jgi:hypothetical protein
MIGKKWRAKEEERHEWLLTRKSILLVLGRTADVGRSADLL